MGPGDLQDVLGDLRHEEHADLLVGLGRSDDAAVYRVTDDVAIVETVDFFPPIVDDPYLFGAIAAANAMSDVYAMGGRVLFALNVAGFPRELPKGIIAAVFRGGADKVREAGGVIAGGHTVVDAEPKYGLCVTGRVDPAAHADQGRASPGPAGVPLQAARHRGDRDRGQERQVRARGARRRGAEHAAAQPRRGPGGAGGGGDRRHRHQRVRVPGARQRDGGGLGRGPAHSQSGPAALAGRARAGRARKLQRRHGPQSRLSRRGPSGGS